MTKSVKQKIGYRIKLARMLKNIERDELAQRLNVSTNYIYKIEAGIGGFSLELIERIATAIGVEIAFFYDWEEKERENERICDEQRPYGAKLEESLMQLIRETIQNELSQRPPAKQTDDEEIAKLILKLPLC